MAYSEKVIEHYENPRNVGSFDKDDPSVGTGLVGAPACGDVMKLQLKITDAGIIEDAKFKTFGCGSAIASSSLATEWVKGMSIDQAMEIKNTQIVEELNLPPVKIHCSVLAEDAIKGAIADYKAKRAEDERQRTAERRKRRRATEHPEQGQGTGKKMAIAVSDKAVAEIKKAAGARATTPERAARRHPRRRLHGFFVPVRVVGSGAACRGQGAGVRGRRGARVRRSEELHLPRRLDAGVPDHDDGPGLQVHEPERERDVRLRRERPVLGSRS